MNKKDRFACGLDVGTSKICLLVVRFHPDGRAEVIGSGYADSQGLRKGVVVDLEEASASIRKAAQEAEVKAALSVDWVIAGISGDHIQSCNCHGAVSIEGKHREVTADYVTQVIQAAQSVPIPAEREILHVLPQEFFLDGRGNIRNPVGLTGSRLDADVHLVSCETALIQNLINAVNRAEMRVKKVVIQQIASAEAVLTGDERELGAAVIDIGGGTTDIALFARDAIRASFVLPVGGDHFTRDLAVGIRTPFQDAERIKKTIGSVLADEIADDEIVEVAGVGTRGARIVSRRVVCRILQDRAAEVLELVKDLIARSGYHDQLIGGAVLTGGGSALGGMIELAEQVLEMPVRQGLPQGVEGMTEELIHPVYATAVGLALIGGEDKSGNQAREDETGDAPWFVNRFLSWVGS